MVQGTTEKLVTLVVTLPLKRELEPLYISGTFSLELKADFAFLLSSISNWENQGLAQLGLMKKYFDLNGTHLTILFITLSLTNLLNFTFLTIWGRGLIHDIMNRFLYNIR